MIGVRDKHNEQFNTLFSFLFPEYEKTCLMEYVTNSEGKFVFAEADEKLKEIYSALKDFTSRNECKNLYNNIRLELRQIEGFSETYKEREALEQLKYKTEAKLREQKIEKEKIMAGKTPLFNKKSKEELVQEAEEKIKQTENDLEELK